MDPKIGKWYWWKWKSNKGNAIFPLFYYPATKAMVFGFMSIKRHVKLIDSFAQWVNYNPLKFSDYEIESREIIAMIFNMDTTMKRDLTATKSMGWDGKILSVQVM
jgi:hypothetical protein